MPFFNLVLFARASNVDYVEVPEDTIWLLSIKCTSCSQNFPKEVGVTRANEVEMQKQHGTANLCIKCKNCERKGYIIILAGSPYRAVVNEDNMIKETLVNFQCRGVQITGVVMKDQFSVQVKDSDTVFHNADFSDLWAEYDEVINEVASVEEQKFDIVRAKDK